MDMTVWYNL